MPGKKTRNGKQDLPTAHRDRKASEPAPLTEAADAEDGDFATPKDEPSTEDDKPLD